jgi:hypothetical protein
MSVFVASTYISEARRTAIDDLLFEVCDELHLSQTRHDLAANRYKTIGQLLRAPGSPFAGQDPEVYPQGSMRLGTTVRPLDGPFDLDFVCQLSLPYFSVDPMALLNQLFTFFKANERYKDMVERKNRCVRLNYADDFYMDILPACRDTAAGLTCIRVPDRAMKGWKGSNPIGYVDWFQQRSRYRMYKFAAARDMQPLPDLEATEEKEVLQLVVQLLKRWRDLFYSRSEFPPISVVLTTLAADLYGGESSTSEALLNVLNGIVRPLDEADAEGRRLVIPNPVHPDEDFSERWDDLDDAYAEFDRGIHHFADCWRDIYSNESNPKAALAEIFGEVVGTVVEKQARRTQSLREKSLLGVKSSGIISSASSAVSRMRPNTNHGDAETR